MPASKPTNMAKRRSSVANCENEGSQLEKLVFNSLCGADDARAADDCELQENECSTKLETSQELAKETRNSFSLCYKRVLNGTQLHVARNSILATRSEKPELTRKTK